MGEGTANRPISFDGTAKFDVAHVSSCKPLARGIPPSAPTLSIQRDLRH